MSTANAITKQDVQVAITLASIGYLGECESSELKTKLMSDVLRCADLPTEGKWDLVWGPFEYETNLWYVALGPKNAQGAQTAAIVIRGTQMNRIESLLEDFEPELVPIPWSTPFPTGAMIATGFATAFDRLMKAKNPSTGENALKFVKGLVKKLGDGTRIDVVGHSLGGALAPLLALTVRGMFPRNVVRSFPFAGQSTGNAAFAKLYMDAFPKQPSRWVNRRDVIPMAFWGMKLIKEMYAAPGPSCPDYVKLVIDVMLPWVGHYSVTGNSAYFEGKLYPKPGKYFPWLDEVSAQHQHFYYMYLAGIRESVIRECFGTTWAPPPPSRPAARRSSPARRGGRPQIAR